MTLAGVAMVVAVATGNDLDAEVDNPAEFSIPDPLHPGQNIEVNLEQFLFIKIRKH